MLAFLVWGAAYGLLALAAVATSEQALVPVLWLVGAGGLAATLLVRLGWSTPHPPVSSAVATMVVLLGGAAGLLVTALPLGDGLVAATVHQALYLAVPVAVYVAGVAPDPRAGAVVGGLAGAGAGIVAATAPGTLLPSVDPVGIDGWVLAESIVLPCWQLAWSGLFGVLLWRLRPAAPPIVTTPLLVAGYLALVLLQVTSQGWGPVVRAEVALAGLVLLVIAGTADGD